MDKKNPYASLDCRTDFDRLLPAIFITAEYDPPKFSHKQIGFKIRKGWSCSDNKSFPKFIHGFLYISLYKEVNKIEWTITICNFLHELRVIP